MPAFSTHYIFAKELLPKIKSEADFEINENALLIGSQGPDIFFFHRIFPWQKGKSLRKAGSAFHRAKFGNILDDFRNHLNQSENKDIAESYIFGFILHYALDRNCHPYIYGIQNKITDKYSFLNPYSVHNTIEFSIDSVMINRFYGIDKPQGFRTDCLICFNEKEKSEAAKTIASAKNEIAPIAFNEKDIETALEDLKYAQKLLYDKSGNKKAILKPIEAIAAPLTKNFKLSSFLKTDDLESAQKYVNINGRMWISPFSGEKSRETFFDLYEKSKKDAINMLKAFQNCENGYTITQNLSFLTGVEVK